MEEKKIIEVEINTEKALANTAKLSKEVAKLATEVNDLRKAEKEGNATREDVLKKEAQLISKKAELRTQKKLLVAVTDSESDSYNKLAAQYSVNTLQLNRMSKAQRENTEEGQKLVAETKAMREQMSSMKKDTGDTSLEVGNYKENIKEAANEMGFFGKAGNAVSGGFGIMSGAARAFTTIPIILVITTLISGLTKLGNIFSSNQEAADGFNKIMKGVSNVINVLIGRVFSLAKGLFNIVTGNFKEGAKQLSDSFTGLSDAINSAYNSGKQMYEMQVELEKANIRSIKTLSELEAKERELQLASDDNTKSLKEREAANKELMKVQLERAKIATDLASQELDLMNKTVVEELKTKKSLSRETTKLYFEKRAALVKAQGEESTIIAENAKKQREIVQDTLMRELDFIIDDYDTRKTITEKIINDEKQTAEERKKRLAELKALGEKAFQDEINIIEKRTGKRIDEQKLINAASTEELNNMIKNSGVSDMVAGRLLEIMKERRLKMAENAETERSLNDSLAQQAIDNLDQQIALWKENNRTRLNGEKELTAQLITEEESRLLNQYNLDVQSLTEKLNLKLIKEGEYNAQLAVLDNQLSDQIKANKAELDAYIFEKQLEQIEQLRIINQDNLLYEFEANQMALDAKYQQEVEAYNRIGKDTTLIDEQYSAQRKEIARLETDAKLNLAQGFAANIKTIAGEQTAIGKTAAIAETTINTYRSATGAYSALASIPYVGPFLGIAAAGAAVTAGVANVKKILAVKTPGGGGGGAAAPSVSGNASAPRPTVTAEIGQGLVSRSLNQQAQGEITLKPVQVVDQVTASQNKQMQNQKTSVL